MVGASDKKQSPVDLEEFERSNMELRLSGSLELAHLASFAARTRGKASVRPDLIPFETLDLMGYEPPIYFSEAAITAPARDPELFYVRHAGKDERLVAETEAWLYPLLHRTELLDMIARAFAYGVIPIVFDWEKGDLTRRVSTDTGERQRVLKRHVHYCRAHELWPGDVTVDAEHDRIFGVETSDGRLYGSEGLERLGDVRAYLAIWDKQFGRLQGQGSRRRAHEPWFQGSYARLWRARYLERSVDAVRVGYAPDGKITLPDGTKVHATKLLRSILTAARNGSAVVVPAKRDKDGNRVWELDKLELPDRDGVFQHACQDTDARMMLATLSPPGMEDGSYEEELFFSFVQSVSNFAAKVLSRIVATTHWLNHGTRGSAAEPPEVIANDVPLRKKRILKEVFGKVADAVHYTSEGKEYTLGGMVSPEILDQLGVGRLSVAEAAHDPKPAAPAPGGPGRPLDLTSDREDRRDDAETDAGSEDTGGEDTGGEGEERSS